MPYFLIRHDPCGIAAHVFSSKKNLNKFLREMPAPPLVFLDELPLISGSRFYGAPIGAAVLIKGEIATPSKRIKLYSAKNA